MIDAIRDWFSALWSTMRALWRRATRGSVWRQSLFAGGAALGLLLIISGVILTSMAPAAAPQQLVVTRATATVTEAATATATATATPRPTVTPRPKAAPKPVATTPPPPPAPPPPPPTPTPSTSGYTGGPVTNDSIFSDFCSSSGSASTPTTSATSTPGGCVSCPFTSGYNSTQSQIAQALANAAANYNLPVNLLKAVAWQESKWHEDVYSCDGGIGLMQIQYYTYPWLNGVSVSDCNLQPTNDDPYTLQGNANLGAKYLKYLYCYYSYWGGYDYDVYGNPHSLSNPTKYTAAWYYKQANLPYPDSSNSNSLCAGVYNDPAHPEYAALPSSIAVDVWSCPYDATAIDHKLLDMAVSAYNAGPGVTDHGINNMWYVSGVEGYIPQFASGALP